MEHPKIKYAEKFGSNWKFNEPLYVGECAYHKCRFKDIYDNYEYFRDDFGHYFCCAEHAHAFYGITSSEVIL